MLVIDNEQVADAYVARLTLGPVPNATQIKYTVANASVYAQLAHQRPDGTLDSFENAAEILVSPETNTYTRVGGIRFRNAVAGVPARVVAQLAQPGDPVGTGGIPFTGVLASNGSVTTSVPGLSLSYVENPANVACPGGFTTRVVGPTGALTFDGTIPIWAEFQCPQFQAGVGSRVQVYLYEDGVAKVLMGTVYNGGDNRPPIFLRRRFTPAAGTHTYDVRIAPSGAGTAQGLTDDSGAAIQPIYLSLTEV